MRLTSEQLFGLLILINTIIVVIYFLLAIILRRFVSKTIIVSVIMLLCPIVGPLYFGVGHLYRRIFFHSDLDGSDVFFSKKRSAILEKADIEREMNMAPMEEALVVSDTGSLRNLMLNVIKGENVQTLSAISLALNSSDSETAHYAASVLRDELNEFRGKCQQVYDRIMENEEGQEKNCQTLIEYMNSFLSQKVFAQVEQITYVHMMRDVCEVLHHTKGYILSSIYYEWIILRLLEIEDYEQCEIWAKRAETDYPYELFPYKCQLKLYFKIMDKEKFFAVMDKLKASNVIIDRETVELIRVFS